MKTPQFMKALTIRQPYAKLIMLPSSDVRHKRVENRQIWRFKHVGEVLIHAGKSQQWCRWDDHGNEKTYNIPIADLDFGAIIGVADLVAVLHYSPGIKPVMIWPLNKVAAEYPWLPDHGHTRGPKCLVLENVQSFPSPIPYRGAQGLFNVPITVVEEQMVKAVRV